MIAGWAHFGCRHYCEALGMERKCDSDIKWFYGWNVNAIVTSIGFMDGVKI